MELLGHSVEQDDRVGVAAEQLRRGSQVRAPLGFRVDSLAVYTSEPRSAFSDGALMCTPIKYAGVVSSQSEISSSSSIEKAFMQCSFLDACA